MSPTLLLASGILPLLLLAGVNLSATAIGQKNESLRSYWLLKFFLASILAGVILYKFCLQEDEVARVPLILITGLPIGWRNYVQILCLLEEEDEEEEDEVASYWLA